MENLPEVRDKISTLPALQAKQQAHMQLLVQAQQETQSLLAQYQKEKRDVENLQKESFANYLRRSVNLFDKKAEKELIEEAAAKARYDKALVRQNQIQEDLNRLNRDITQLQQLATQYNAELQARRNTILQSPSAGQLAALEAQRQAALAQTIEVSQALAAAQRAITTVHVTATSLNEAEGWATWDVWGGGGIITHSQKYSHIDHAEECFNLLAAQLWELSNELRDVQNIPFPALNVISSNQRTMDFWFDNIFTDLSVRSQIQNNQEQLAYLFQNLNYVVAMLQAKYAELQTFLHTNNQQQENLLISF